LSLDYGPDGSAIKDRMKIALAAVATKIAASTRFVKKETRAEDIVLSMKLNGLVDLNYFTGKDKR